MQTRFGAHASRKPRCFTGAFIRLSGSHVRSELFQWPAFLVPENMSSPPTSHNCSVTYFQSPNQRLQLAFSYNGNSIPLVHRYNRLTSFTSGIQRPVVFSHTYSLPEQQFPSPCAAMSWRFRSPPSARATLLEMALTLAARGSTSRPRLAVPEEAAEHDRPKTSRSKASNRRSNTPSASWKTKTARTFQHKRQNG